MASKIGRTPLVLSSKDPSAINTTGTVYGCLEWLAKQSQTHHSKSCCFHASSLCSCECESRREREMFYLTTHSTHFIYGYMASDIWLRTILIVRKETRCCHIGYSYRLTARVLLYAPSHRQDNTYHGLCYTSRGALTGTRNSSMYPPPMKDRSDDPPHHERTLYLWATSRSANLGKKSQYIYVWMQHQTHSDTESLNNFHLICLCISTNTLFCELYVRNKLIISILNIRLILEQAAEYIVKHILTWDILYADAIPNISHYKKIKPLLKSTVISKLDPGTTSAQYEASFFNLA